MHAMILAAGRGERMRPLTDHTPKPLIDVGPRSLIGHHLHRLAEAGIVDVVINTAYLGEQIQQALGDGRSYGVQIRYSAETPGALDTGGGVAQALPLLGAEPFLVISSDIFSDIDYRAFVQGASSQDMHLALVDNPAHHAAGDFGLDDGRLVDRAPKFTYAGVGVYHPRLFQPAPAARFALVQLMRSAIAAQRATGWHHSGCWIDVGRPLDLERARQHVAASAVASP